MLIANSFHKSKLKVFMKNSTNNAQHFKIAIHHTLVSLAHSRTILSAAGVTHRQWTPPSAPPALLSSRGPDSDYMYTARSSAEALALWFRHVTALTSTGTRRGVLVSAAPPSVGVIVILAEWHRALCLLSFDSRITAITCVLLLAVKPSPL